MTPAGVDVGPSGAISPMQVRVNSQEVDAREVARRQRERRVEAVALPTASQLLDEMPDELPTDGEEEEQPAIVQPVVPFPRPPPATAVQLPMPMEDDEEEEEESVAILSSPSQQPLQPVDTHPPSLPMGSEENMDWRADDEPDPEQVEHELKSDSEPDSDHDGAGARRAAAALPAFHTPRGSSLSLPLSMQPSQMTFVPPTAGSLSLPPMTQQQSHQHQQQHPPSASSDERKDNASSYSFPVASSSTPSSGDISIPMSICEVPASQLQMMHPAASQHTADPASSQVQPSQYQGFSSQPPQSEAAEPEQEMPHQISLDAHDLESSDEELSGAKPSAAPASEPSEASAPIDQQQPSARAHHPESFHSFVRQSDSNELGLEEDLLQFDTSVVPRPLSPLSPSLSAAASSDQAPTSFSLQVSPFRASLPSPSHTPSPAKPPSPLTAAAIGSASSPAPSFLSPTLTTKRCLYPPNRPITLKRPPVAPTAAVTLPPAAFALGTAASPAFSPESDTPPCGQPNPPSESPSPPPVAHSTTVTPVAPRTPPTPASPAAPYASSPLRRHRPPASPRTPRSILSTSTTRVRAARNVRFDLPSATPPDKANSGVSPRKIRAAAAAGSELSATAQRAAEANQQMWEEEQSEATRWTASTVDAAAGAAPSLDWNHDISQLSMHLTSCSQFEAPMVDLPAATAVAATVSSIAVVAPPAAAESAFSPTTSPMKPPILPLSDESDDVEMKDSHADARTPAAAAAASSSLAGSAQAPISLYDEYAPSQVFDDPYEEPWMVEVSKKEEEPMPTQPERPTPPIAADAVAGVATRVHCTTASDFHTSSSSSSSSATSVILSSSPPGFIVPSQPSTGIRSGTTSTTGWRLKEEALERREVEQRRKIKQERVTNAATAGGATGGAAAGKTSPNRLVPMRAPPTFFSPPPTEMSQAVMPAPAAAERLDDRHRVKVEAVKSIAARHSSALAAAAAASAAPAQSISALTNHTSARPTIKHRPNSSPTATASATLASSGFDLEEPSFAPPEVLTMALQKIKSEKRSASTKRERPSSTKEAKEATEAAAKALVKDDGAMEEDEIEQCPSMALTAAAAVAASSAHVAKYKRPRVLKSESRSAPTAGSASAAPAIVPAASTTPKRVAKLADGTVHQELPTNGIDNTLRSVVDGQTMEDIEEYAEEETSGVDGKHQKKTKKADKGKGKGKKRAPGDSAADPPVDKKQRTLDTMHLKTERVQLELDGTPPEDAVMVIAPPPTSAATGAPVPSAATAAAAFSASTPAAKAKKSKPAPPADPKQPSLSGFFSKAPTTATAAAAPVRPSTPITAAGAVPAPPTAVSPSGAPIPSVKASKRTYAGPAEMTKKQQRHRPSKGSDHKKQHETVDLVDGDDPMTELAEVDERKRQDSSDDLESDDAASPSLVAMLSARVAVRSASDPGDHRRLQRQLDACAAAIAKPSKPTKVAPASGSATKSKAKKKLPKITAPKPQPQPKMDDLSANDESQVY